MNSESLFALAKGPREAGITPQQHQLLLGVEGFTGRRWATISELAEFLQARHNAGVGLVDRARRRGLVTKRPVARDRRLVRVDLTPEGRKILSRLAALHRQELTRVENHAAGPGRLLFRYFSKLWPSADLKIKS